MDIRTVKLNLAQLSKSFTKSKHNKYSDSRKASYQDKLNELFDIISNEDISKLSSNDLYYKKLVIDFIYESLEFLDNSTLTTIPFEIIYCIESVLEDWINNNNFIVVTSLNNNLLSFSIRGFLAFNEPIYQYIKNEYGIEFENRLIQINLPRYLMHDYLANVVLFHELGHFIDNYYKITSSTINNKIFNGTLNNADPNLNKLINHYREYFADLFASQYIGDTSSIYLNHIAFKEPDSISHPSTNKRIAMVENFLNSSTDIIKDELMQSTNVITKKELAIRYASLDSERFNELLPYEINNIEELVSVFISGWRTWTNTPNVLSDKYGDNVTYKIINNLIEKSISNYIVLTKWRLCNVPK